ncbi:MAG: metallophosphoesterase [Acidobacteriota bacterium]|nr:metallophosphoesterase [Acidobacteriota bacterium]
MEQSPVSRRKFSSRWQEIKSSPHPFRRLATDVSRAARRAIDESKNLIIEEQTIYLERLPRAMDGLRVVQLSDVHHSRFTDAAQIKDSVAIANLLEADITVLTGDYVSYGTDYIAPVADILGELRAPQGVYAVLGNHDYRADARLITDLFRSEGIRVLINEGLHLEKNGAALWLCGLDDTIYGEPNLELALAGSRPAEFKFLLCHNPAILRRAVAMGIDFIVSGHTHGGQVRLRANEENLILPRRPRVSGLMRRGATQIYVSRGIGTVVLPFRYQCPPEISFLELRSAQ